MARIRKGGRKPASRQLQANTPAVNISTEPSAASLPASRVAPAAAPAAAAAVEEDERMCSICHEAMEANSDLLTLDCDGTAHLPASSKHTYHACCLRTWVVQHKSSECPMCRCTMDVPSLAAVNKPSLDLLCSSICDTWRNSQDDRDAVIDTMIDLVNYWKVNGFRKVVISPSGV